jgi:hypothetical protein
MGIFKKLKELDFPLGEYVLVGSGPLAARGIREASDLDIAVTDKLWRQLFDSGDYKRKKDMVVCSWRKRIGMILILLNN